MRRRIIHGAFAGLVCGIAIAAAYEGMELRHAFVVDRAIDEVSRRGRPPGPATPFPAFPEARLAAANALSAAGEFDEAAGIFMRLIREGRQDEVGRAAAFNLANMYLRQGELAIAGGDAARGLTLIELAKQRYRDLLRGTAGDWDARYNLERALRLAPEENPLDGEPQEPVGQQRIKTDKPPPMDLP